MDEKTKKGIDKTVEIRYNNGRARRGVAQFGRVLGLGPRCRRFKSCRLDQKNLVKLLTMDQKPAIINRLSPQYAGVAQLVEQLICNQQVGGSSPSTSSTKLKISYGRVPEWPKGADCKSVVSDFGGPNPPSPTKSDGHFCVHPIFVCIRLCVFKGKYKNFSRARAGFSSESFRRKLCSFYLPERGSHWFNVNYL